MASSTESCWKNSEVIAARPNVSLRGCAQHPPRQADVIDRLVRLLEAEVPHSPATIAYAAAQIHTSIRTLQRRLSATGLTFTGLLDEIRRSAAIELVLAGALTGTQIAHTLGYSDQAHFTRAFKRWTGVSPRQYVAGRPSLGP
jgi:AraC-like DNA-binding protein